MSNKRKPLWPVDINCWYKTTDQKELYKVVFRSAGRYEVISYYNGNVILSGSMNDCKRFVANSCGDHISFMQRMANAYVK